MNVNDLKTLEELLRNKHNRSEYITRVEAIYNSKTVYPKELKKLKNKRPLYVIISVIISILIVFITYSVYNHIEHLADTGGLNFFEDMIFAFGGGLLLVLLAIGAVCLTLFLGCKTVEDINGRVRDLNKRIDYGLRLEKTNKSEASVAHQILNGKLTWEVLRKPLADMDSQINRIVSTIPEHQRRIIFREKRSDEKERTLSDFASCISEIIRHMKHGDTFYSACEKADERYWKGVHARARCMEENQRIRNMEKNLSDIADGIRQGNADAERRYEEEKFRQEMRDIFRR